jgi:hypothetical protein
MPPVVRFDAWHVTFFDPLRSVEMRQIGRQVGNDIVQIGDDAAGFTRRWRFTEITARSFTWLGDVSWDQGATWTLELEMRARRVGRIGNASAKSRQNWKCEREESAWVPNDVAAPLAAGRLSSPILG